MSNFLSDILEAAEDEKILFIHVKQAYNWNEAPLHGYPLELENAVLPFDAVYRHLNYSYNDGFGGQDCHDIVAWTENKVLYIHECDGSTAVRSLPRNP